MIIQSSAGLRDALANKDRTLATIERDGKLELAVDAVSKAPVAAPAKIAEVQISLKFADDDPDDIRAAAQHLEVAAQSLTRRADKLQKPAPTPILDITRSGSGLVLGAAGGFGAGLLLQQLGKLGQAYNNPYVNAATIACSLVGATVGGSVGSGLVKIEIDKFGVKASSK